MPVAVVVTQHGGPEVLQLQQQPIPATPDDGVLIEQHCAGVNYIDTCVAACGLASLLVAVPARVQADQGQPKTAPKFSQALSSRKYYVCEARPSLHLWRVCP